MVFTANHCTDNFVRPRFVGSGEREFLFPGLKEQVPSVNPGPVLGSQQGEAMDRTIAIPRFTAVSRHTQKHWLPPPDGDLRSTLTGDLVTAVAVGGYLDDPGLCISAGQPDQESARRRNPH